MSKKDTFFSRICSQFAGWKASLDESREENTANQFKDPYSDLDYLHDQEMERLVKVLENTQNDSVRYQ